MKFRIIDYNRIRSLSFQGCWNALIYFFHLAHIPYFINNFTIGLCKLTSSMFLTVFEVAFPHTSIRIDYFALAVLLVFVPMAFVAETAIFHENSISGGVVVNPITFVNISIWIFKSSMTMKMVFLPFSLITWSHWPILYSIPIPFLIFPLTLIYRSIFHRYHLKILNFRHLF